jgi:hypothetical protein
MNEPDDDLGSRLRDVLRDGALSVPAAPNALDRIHAGARRRQHRRNAASSAAAVVVVAMAATGVVALRPHAHATVSAGKEHTTSPSVSVTPSTVGVVSPAPTTALPSASASQPSVSTIAVNFDPVSVTAISTNSYWVLGSTACAAVRCAALAHTTDGGATFTRLGRTSDGSPMPSIVTTVEDGTTVRDVRFGDPKNGWLYGGALYATHDGGATWAPDNSIPNDVVDLAAASGEVWAVALRVISGAETYGLYHATYGPAGTSAWTNVPLGTAPMQEPGLAVVNQNALLLGQTPSGAAQLFDVTRNGNSTSQTSRPAPCASGGNVISVAGDGALWIHCDGNPDTLVFVSNDQGAHWLAVPGATGSVIVGGVDAQHALAINTTGLVLVSTNGVVANVTNTPTPGTAEPNFVGFTTTRIGFILTRGAIGAKLWRTTDGGQTWAVVVV